MSTRGFTLIEMMIALIISSVLMMGTVTFFTQLYQSKGANQKYESAFQSMLLPLQVFEKDLKYATAVIDSTPPPYPADPFAMGSAGPALPGGVAAVVLIKAVSLSMLKQVSIAAPVIPVSVEYRMYTAPCPPDYPGSTCKSLVRTVSEVGIPVAGTPPAPVSMNFEGFLDLDWCLPGSASGDLEDCSSALSALSPSPDFSLGKRFLILASRGGGWLNSKVDIPLVVDLENFGYNTPGAIVLNPRPQFVRR